MDIMNKTDIELANSIKLAYTKSPVLTPKLFNQVIDLIRRIVEAQISGGSGGSGSMTAEQIRDALQTLQNSNRLNASAIHNLAMNVVFNNPDNGQSVNIIQMVDYLLNLINSSTIPPGPGTGIQFLDDTGNYVQVDWSMILNRPTKTSQFINDGDNGSSQFITVDGVENILINRLQSDTGVISGMSMSNSVNYLSVNDGSYVINDSLSSIIDVVNYSGGKIKVSDLSSSNSIVYIAIDKYKNFVFKYEEFTSIERRDLALLGYAEYDSTGFQFCHDLRVNLKSPIHQIYDIVEANGIKSISGNKLRSDSGLKLSKSAGTYFGFGLDGSNSAKPNKYVSSEQLDLNIIYVGDNFKQVLSNSSEILTNFIVNFNSLVPLTLGKFGMTRLSLALNTKWYAEISSVEYDNLDDAKASIEDFAFASNKPLLLQSFYLIYKSSITNINDAINVSEFEFVNENGETISTTITYQNVVNALGYVPEDIANKVETLDNPNHVTYPTTQAVSDAIEESRKTTERFDFVNQTLVVCDYSILGDVKAFLYVNNKEALANIFYDKVNSKVIVSLSKPKTGYVLVTSLVSA